MFTPPVDEEANPRRIVQALKQLGSGRSNAVGRVTLRDGEVTTVVTAINCGPDSAVFLSPISATAMADFPSCRISSVGQGEFTITHPNTADTDKEFFWIALG